jgi:hypothetical protein
MLQHTPPEQYVQMLLSINLTKMLKISTNMSYLKPVTDIGRQNEQRIPQAFQVFDDLQQIRQCDLKNISTRDNVSN